MTVASNTINYSSLHIKALQQIFVTVHYISNISVHLKHWALCSLYEEKSNSSEPIKSFFT